MIKQINITNIENIDIQLIKALDEGLLILPLIRMI